MSLNNLSLAKEIAKAIEKVNIPANTLVEIKTTECSIQITVLENTSLPNDED